MDAAAPPPAWHALAAGAASACVSRTVTYPPDTVKARLQVQGGSGGAMLYRGTADAFAKIARREGVAGFYRGFGGILLTVIPANCCYFSGYEFGRRVGPQQPGLAKDLTAALIAQTIAGVAFCPIDIVKQRVQTQQVLNPGERTSPLMAVRAVHAAAGVPGFFKGFLAMNALWLPWNLIYISLYEASKRRIYYWRLAQAGGVQEWQTPEGVRVRRDPPMNQVLPLWAFPLCSALCSATASVATHPIDVVKTRLQVLSNRGGNNGGGGGGSVGSGGGGGGGEPRLTAWQVCRQLYLQEGAAGFARGLGARVATMSTGSAVTWMTYEGVKRWLARPAAALEHQQQAQQLSAGLHGRAQQQARTAE